MSDDVKSLREQADRAELDYRLADFRAAKARLATFRAELALNRLDVEHTRQIFELKPGKRCWSKRWAELAETADRLKLARTAYENAQHKERTQNDLEKETANSFAAAARAYWEAIQGRPK